MSPHWDTLTTELTAAVGHGKAAKGPLLGDDPLLDFEEHAVSTSATPTTSMAVHHSVRR